MTQVFHPGNVAFLKKDFFPYGHEGDLFTIVAYGRDLTMVRCNEVYTITIEEFNENFEIKTRVKQAWELEFEIEVFLKSTISFTSSRRLNDGVSSGIDSLSSAITDWWAFYHYAYGTVFVLLNFIVSNDGDADISIKYAGNKILKVETLDKRDYRGLDPLFEWIDTFKPEGID